MTFIFQCDKHNREDAEKYAGLTFAERLLKMAAEPVEERTECSEPPCRIASQIIM